MKRELKVFHGLSGQTTGGLSFKTDPDEKGTERGLSEARRVQDYEFQD